MKLMSMKQYSKMTKAGLVRKIMKALKKLPKTKLIKLCYELEKRRLPTISTTKRNMPRLTARRAFTGKEKKIIEDIKRMKPRKKSKFQITGKKKDMIRGIDYFDSWSDIVGKPSRRKKPRSAKQRANDKRLGRMAKERAKAIRQGKRISYNMRA